MDKQEISQKNIQKLLRESFRAASIVVKNKEIIETLFSIHQIKSGNYNTYSSAKEMFQKLGIWED